MVKEGFEDRFRFLMEQQGMTLPRLAQKVGLGLPLLTDIVTGRQAPPRDVVQVLADHLGVKPSFFLGEDELAARPARSTEGMDFSDFTYFQSQSRQAQTLAPAPRSNPLPRRKGAPEGEVEPALMDSLSGRWDLGDDVDAGLADEAPTYSESFEPVPEAAATNLTGEPSESARHEFILPPDEQVKTSAAAPAEEAEDEYDVRESDRRDTPPDGTGDLWDFEPVEPVPPRASGKATAAAPDTDTPPGGRGPVRHLRPEEEPVWPSYPWRGGSGSDGAGDPNEVRLPVGEAVTVRVDDNGTRDMLQALVRLLLRKRIISMDEFEEVLDLVKKAKA